MRRAAKAIAQYLPWLLLLLGVDAFAALLLWIADARALRAMTAVIMLATALLFAGICYVLSRRERKKEQAFLDFLREPDEYHEQLLLEQLDAAQREGLPLLGKELRRRQRAYADLQTQLNEYEDYVESWAHETKTPLSLLTLLLDNRREELGPELGFRLDYIRNRMQESVDQMLFYARIKGARKDQLFEQIEVRGCIEDVLEDYRPLLEEKGFRVELAIGDDTVYSDRRGLHFLLAQIVSNAVKYSGARPKLSFTMQQEKGRAVLSIRDNGIGVRSCDLPYIFEKGFTGDTGTGRKKATGMGLYLAKEIARELNILPEAQSEWGAGFEMRLSFPIVDHIRESFPRDASCPPP